MAKDASLLYFLKEEGIIHSQMWGTSHTLAFKWRAPACWRGRHDGVLSVWRNDIPFQWVSVSLWIIHWLEAVAVLASVILPSRRPSGHLNGMLFSRFPQEVMLMRLFKLFQEFPTNHRSSFDLLYKLLDNVALSCLQIAYNNAECCKLIKSFFLVFFLPSTQKENVGLGRL